MLGGFNGKMGLMWGWLWGMHQNQPYYKYFMEAEALLWIGSGFFLKPSENCYSGTKVLKCGVPQESILGLLLFLISINDHANIYKHNMPILFVSDSNLCINGKSASSMELESNEKISNIASWLKINQLSHNVNKTQFFFYIFKETRPNRIYCNRDWRTGYKSGQSYINKDSKRYCDTD